MRRARTRATPPLEPAGAERDIERRRSVTGHGGLLLHRGGRPRAHPESCEEQGHPRPGRCAVGGEHASRGEDRPDPRQRIDGPEVRVGLGGEGFEADDVLERVQPLERPERVSIQPPPAKPRRFDLAPIEQVSSTSRCAAWTGNRAGSESTSLKGPSSCSRLVRCSTLRFTRRAQSRTARALVAAPSPTSSTRRGAGSGDDSRAASRVCSTYSSSASRRGPSPGCRISPERRSRRLTSPLPSTTGSKSLSPTASASRPRARRSGRRGWPPRMPAHQHLVVPEVVDGEQPRCPARACPASGGAGRRGCSADR